LLILKNIVNLGVQLLIKREANFSLRNLRPFYVTEKNCPPYLIMREHFKLCGNLSFIGHLTNENLRSSGFEQSFKKYTQSMCYSV